MCHFGGNSKYVFVPADKRLNDIIIIFIIETCLIIWDRIITPLQQGTLPTLNVKRCLRISLILMKLS